MTKKQRTITSILEQEFGCTTVRAAEIAKRLVKAIKPVAKELVNENNPHPRVSANSDPGDDGGTPIGPGGH